ncbi:MAG: cupredoxin domain-containing protein [Deltaproteobacteria bacterium]|nr:cupredoxin domain-containing protein [Deltaproteobacteria bacterium]
MESVIFLFIFAFISICYLTSGTTYGEPTPVQATVSEDGVQRIDVKVDSYSFEPNHIVVTVGKPVELILKSVTKVLPHNFTLNYPEAGLNVDQDISHGQEVKVTFTPTKTGSFDFYCDKKFLFESHRKKGMKGILEVK